MGPTDNGSLGGEAATRYHYKRCRLWFHDVPDLECPSLFPLPMCLAFASFLRAAVAAFLCFPVEGFWGLLVPPSGDCRKRQTGYDLFRPAEPFISAFVGLCILLCYDNFPVLAVNERVPCFGPFCLRKHHEDVFCIQDALPIIILDTVTEVIGNCNSWPLY